MHVRHRNDRDAADLKAALRAAEAAVKEKLDYTIALTEKPLFDYSSAVSAGTMEATVSAAHTATDDEEVCDSDDEGLTEERGRRMHARNEGPPSPHPENDAVKRGYDAAAAAADAAAAAGASPSTQGPAAVCGNKRSLSEIDDDDPELDAVMAEEERRS
jgi:hypothetical protein